MDIIDLAAEDIIDLAAEDGERCSLSLDERLIFS